MLLWILRTRRRQHFRITVVSERFILNISSIVTISIRIRDMEIVNDNPPDEFVSNTPRTCITERPSDFLYQTLRPLDAEHSIGPFNTVCRCCVLNLAEALLTLKRNGKRICVLTRTSIRYIFYLSSKATGIDNFETPTNRLLLFLRRV